MVNALSRKTRRPISGFSAFRSKRTNPARIARPPAMHTQVAQLSQPQDQACWNPSTLSPMPAAIRAAPGTSRVPERRRSELCARAVRTSATIATGTLTQNTARQVQLVSQPPSSGPMAVSAR